MTISIAQSAASGVNTGTSHSVSLASAPAQDSAILLFVARADGGTAPGEVLSVSQTGVDWTTDGGEVAAIQTSGGGPTGKLWIGRVTSATPGTTITVTGTLSDDFTLLASEISGDVDWSSGPGSVYQAIDTGRVNDASIGSIAAPAYETLVLSYVAFSGGSDTDQSITPVSYTEEIVGDSGATSGGSSKAVLHTITTDQAQSPSVVQTDENYVGVLLSLADTNPGAGAVVNASATSSAASGTTANATTDSAGVNASAVTTATTSASVSAGLTREASAAIEFDSGGSANASLSQQISGTAVAQSGGAASASVAKNASANSASTSSGTATALLSKSASATVSAVSSALVSVPVANGVPASATVLAQSQSSATASISAPGGVNASAVAAADSGALASVTVAGALPPDRPEQFVQVVPLVVDGGLR